MSHFLTLLVRATACLLLFGPLALLPPDLLAQDAGTLAPVTVTAGEALPLDRPATAGSLLGLTPLQTPASIEAIDRAQLESRGDTSLVDAVTRATGISSLAHPGNSGSSLSARGFTDTTSVMRLYDGTRQYGGVGVSFPFDTWSIDRIEVLRGPASVLHGDGAIGGVINVVPKKPTRGPIRHEVRAIAGTRGKGALALGSGGALDDRWSYRLDASGDRSHGWVDRGDSRNLNVSGALRLDLSPRLQLTLSHAEGRQHPMRYFGTPLIEGAQRPALATRNYNVEDSAIRFHDRWTELAARWTPGGVAVRSKLYRIESDRYWRNAETYAFDPATRRIDRSGNTEIAHRQTQTGNTTDATFDGRLFGRANTVAVGVDLNRSEFQHRNNTYVGSSGAVDPFDPVPGFYASSVPFIPRYRNEAEQYALFGEDRLELSARLSVVAGWRHDHARLRRHDLVTGVQAFERSYAHTGGRLGLVYLVRPDTSIYAQFSRAADLVSGLLMLSAANANYGVSTGRQVEVGIKQTLPRGRGEWTLAVYDIRKKHLLTRDPIDPFLRVQVGQRSSRGIESTLSVPFGRTVRLEANAAVLRARYDDFTETVGGVAVSRVGNLPTDVPERTANLWLNWRAAPEWTVGAGLRHLGKRYADNANTLVLPASTTADLSVQWTLRPDTALTLRGFNLFDKRYYTTAYYTANQWFVAEGRRIELALNHRF